MERIRGTCSIAGTDCDRALTSFSEYRYYRFGLSLGLANLRRNGLVLGWKKTLGKIAQPINSYTRFPEYWYFEQEIARHLASLSRSRSAILDVGSPKLVGLFLAVHYPIDLHLTDITPLNLDEYKVLWELVRPRARGSVVFSTQDARALPYPDSTFDVVYAMSVVEHVEGSAGDTAAIRELMRVLRPGGRLVISVPFGPRYVEQFRVGLAGAAERTSDDRPRFFQRIYDVATVRTRLIGEASGLADVTMTSVRRERAGLARAFGRAGENVRALLGWTSPLLSKIVNRRDDSLRAGQSNRYDAMSSESDVYGDVMFTGRKA